MIGLEWQDRALCREVGGDDFFPEKGCSVREAKRICSRCEVQTECLEYAIATRAKYGVWGGLSEKERRKLQRRPAA